MKNNTKAIFSSVLLFAGALTAQATAPADNWDNSCASCHGTDGNGQTKTGKKLKLLDYTDAKIQADLKDDEMTKAITNGVKVDGKEKMKSFKDEFSPEEIKALVDHVRKFKA